MPSPDNAQRAAASVAKTLGPEYAYLSDVMIVASNDINEGTLLSLNQQVTCGVQAGQHLNAHVT